MKKYVPLDKRSKKARKEYYSGLRHTWCGLNPVTRTVPNGKAYNRNKDKQERYKISRESGDGFDADFLRFFLFVKSCVCCTIIFASVLYWI